MGREKKSRCAEPFERTIGGEGYIAKDDAKDGVDDNGSLWDWMSRLTLRFEAGSNKARLPQQQRGAT
jgi:hypothetical protein